MFTISRVSNALSSIWQQMPSPITLTLIAGSAYICTRTTSDYRIRAAVIAAAGVLYLIAKRVQQLYRPQPRVYDLPRAVPQLPVEPHTNHQTSYFDLLPAELQRKVATFYDYSEKKRLETQVPIAPWMVEFQKGLKAGDEAYEEHARRALDAEGIHYFPEIVQTYPELSATESAIDHLRRYQALFAPESRLLGPRRRVLKLLSLPLTGNYVHQKGPLLFTHEGRDIVTTHWPTGKILSRKPHNGLPRDWLNLKGERFDYRDPKAPKFEFEYQIAPIEILDPRKLYDHASQEEIVLDQDCSGIRYFKDSYLLFQNTEGVWIKKRSASSILSEIGLSEPYRVWLPYIITNKGVYSIDTGKQLLAFNEAEPCDPQRAIIVKNVNLPGDIIHYLVQTEFSLLVPGDNFREIKRSLQDPLFHEYTPEQFSLTASFTTHGRLHIINSGGMLQLFASNRSSIIHFHEIEGPRFTIGPAQEKVLAVYNSYILHKKRNPAGKIHYFVIDLADQSLSARLAGE